MADIELVIKIPEEAKQAFDCAESNDLKGCYYDLGGVIGNAIKNGTPLPEHHGALKDVDKLIPDMCETIGCGYQAVSCMQIDLAPTIIPATKEEKHCKACKYSDNGMINVESERCKACYYDGRLGGNCLFVPKQTATKEGE